MKVKSKEKVWWNNLSEDEKSFLDSKYFPNVTIRDNWEISNEDILKIYNKEN